MGTVAILPASFFAVTSWLYYLASVAPSYPEEEFTLSFPSSLDDLKSLTEAFTYYKKENNGYVILLFISAYLYKQTFAIPGSVFLNVLAGALYGQVVGFFLVCFLSSVGASLCYMLSLCCGKIYIQKYFTTKLKTLQLKVVENQDHLFSFLLFIRLFPMTPNWFINLASPIVNIPLHKFFISVFIGLMPYNMMCIQTGAILSQVQSMDDIFTSRVIFGLFLLSLLVILPTVIKKIVFHHQKKS